MTRRTRNIVVGVLLASLLAACLWWIVSDRQKVRHALRQSRDRARHRLRVSRRRRVARRHLEQGRWKGYLYRTSHRFPDPEVDEDVLADRVRSTLGPWEKRFDIPRVHVTAERHRIILHGEVDCEDTKRLIEEQTRKISGVRAVVSHLTVGFTRGDTRPSQGRVASAPSPMATELSRAAVGAGVPAENATAAVGGVLIALLARLPVATRRHLLAHIPADVVATLPPEDWEAAPNSAVRKRSEMLDEVASLVPVERPLAEGLVREVFGRLRALVPEEAAPVASTLPAELRSLWEAA